MSAGHPLMELAERKRLLVLQADLHRTMLRAEGLNACARLSWLNQARHQARAAGPWLAAGMATVGLVAAWRGYKLATWIPRALAAWRAWRRLRAD